MEQGFKCQCGSGRQQKNCCGKRKPRTFTFLLDTKNIHEGQGLAITNNGQILSINKGQLSPLVGDNCFEYSYQRESGKPKVLTTGPISGENCFLNPNLPITKFQNLFAVDTNTKQIGPNRVSVGCVVHCKVGGVVGDILRLEVSTLMAAIEIWNAREKPENIVWVEFIQAVLKSGLAPIGDIGFIVDSDLSEHQSFNRREKPIFADYYLPDRFTLLYGSGETGKECLANKLIGFCDQRAKFLIKMLDENNPAEGIQEVEGRPYTHFRQWQPDAESPDNHFPL